MRKTTCLEIENPYRYRSYIVGQKPYFDVHDLDYMTGNENKIVKEITFEYDERFYCVTFADGSCTEISINQSGLIVHTDAYEVEDDEGLD